MEDKIKELKDKTMKLRWDIFKDKEIANLISHIFNTTKVLYDGGNYERSKDTEH